MIQAAAYRSWRNGEVVPGRIALARAYCYLPQQSIANVCGTDIETVDLWEQGVEYPTWDELIDLMAITGLNSTFFIRPLNGPRGLFAVPDSWADDLDELTGLEDEVCTEAVEISINGWPVNMEDLPDSSFG